MIWNKEYEPDKDGYGYGSGYGYGDGYGDGYGYGYGYGSVNNSQKIRKQ